MNHKSILIGHLQRFTKLSANYMIKPEEVAEWKACIRALDVAKFYEPCEVVRKNRIQRKVTRQDILNVKQQLRIRAGV